MADINLRLQHTVSPRLSQRTVLLGRVKMAQAVKLPETEWAKLLAEIEKDPLFQELLGASSSGQHIVRYKKASRFGMAGQFYDMQEANVVGGSGVSPESLIAQKKQLLALIKKLGQEKFEKYFLYREEGESVENMANVCGISIDEVKQVNDFILNMSVLSEFYYPSMLQNPQLLKPTLVGRIVKNEDRTYSISFFSPHLARGTYEINYAALRLWQKGKKLGRPEAARLRRYIGVLEMSNLKQGAFFRVLDYLVDVQKDYFDTQDDTKMAPVSLRHVARQIKFAPSTISRVLSFKSVLLPWEREVLITHLMPGQRRVLLSIIEKIHSHSQKRVTDAELARKIGETHGIKVSRRTITACRHVLSEKENKAS
ncbi:MAG: hypothetical protein LHV69_05485 [Elusimicrobia bacterium]|nr:hypothetical protein [Candidatus Obscuribacterium magneticum]